MRLKCPCKDCPDRHIKCHNETCPHGWNEYKEQAEKMRKMKVFKNETLRDFLEIRRNARFAIKKGLKK